MNQSVLLMQNHYIQLLFSPSFSSLQIISIFEDNTPQICPFCIPGFSVFHLTTYQCGQGPVHIYASFPSDTIYGICSTSHIQRIDIIPVFRHLHNKSGVNSQMYLSVSQRPNKSCILLLPIWILTATKTSPAAFAIGEVMLKYRFIWMDSLNQLSGGYFTYFSVIHIFQNSSQPVQVFFYIDIVNSVPVMRFTAIDHVFSRN